LAKAAEKDEKFMLLFKLLKLILYLLLSFSIKAAKKGFTFH